MPNKLSKLEIKEISLVDEPASEGSDIILTKNRGCSPMTIAFEPVLVRKAREPNDEGGEEDAEAAEGQDEEAEDGMEDDETKARERAAFLRHREAAVKRHVMKQLKAAGLIRVRKGRKSTSGADIDGADMRDAAQQADDAELVVRACKANPPAASESLPDWLARIADALGVTVDQMYGSDLRAAQLVYQEFMAQNVLKRRAAETLDTLAKRRAAIDKSRSYFQHWRDLVNENPALYSGIQKSSGADFGVTAPPAADPGWSRVSDNWGGGAEGDGTALDALNAEAADIEKASIGSRKRLTKQQAFVEACKARPDLYAAHKRGE